MKDRSHYPRAGTNCWKPRYVPAYSRVPVNEDPREHTRMLVRTVAKQLLGDVQDRKTMGYLDSLRKRCRRMEFYDAYERMQGEVNRP